MAIDTSEKLQFLSRPYNRRAALLPTILAIAFCFPLVAIGYFIATAELQYFRIWGAISLAFVAAFSAYLVYLSWRLAKESKEKFELTIDGDLIQLDAYDEQGDVVRQSVSLRNVTSAEYFQPRDSASLTLNDDARLLELPLWSFGYESERQIVEYVKSRGVKIVGVPNEIVF